MTIPTQKTFGEFTRDRFGSNWVFAARITDNIRARYNKPDCPVVVITPKQQAQLKADYAREWGREHDPVFWQMLCALRAAKGVIERGEHILDAYEPVCAAIELASK